MEGIARPISWYRISICPERSNPQNSSARRADLQTDITQAGFLTTVPKVSAFCPVATLSSCTVVRKLMIILRGFLQVVRISKIQERVPLAEY